MMLLKRKIQISAIVLFIVFLADSVMSCTVPVFQYAMERWAQSYYHGVLFYKGSLSQEDKETFASFQQMLKKNNSLLNLQVEKLNVESKPGQYKQLLKGTDPGHLPALALWYPRQKGQNKPFWIGELQMSVLANIAKSSKRREMTGHLIEGSPVVWLLVYPQEQENIQAQLNNLKGGIAKSIEAMKKSPQFKPILEGNGKEVSFPVITISSGSREESVVLSMITGLRDGSSVKEPVVIPVFGRGRALTTFTADKISEERIYNIMTFLMSPCACQIKMASPGTDMLVQANWQKAFDEYSQQNTSPTLTGVMPDSSSETTMNTENDTIIDLTTDQQSSFVNSKIVTSAGGIIGILVIVIGIVTVIVLKRK
jgi:hypothetical protein